jgi:hypothetical protein
MRRHCPTAESRYRNVAVELPLGIDTDVIAAVSGALRNPPVPALDERFTVSADAFAMGLPDES